MAENPMNRNQIANSRRLERALDTLRVVREED